MVRPKEPDLLPLLEVGVIDCLLIYRSVAVQHGLPFLELPTEINLSDPQMDDQYGAVGVRLLADRPEAVDVRGSAIVYGATVPLNAPRPDAGRAFLDLLQSEDGRRILSECGQEPL